MKRPSRKVNVGRRTPRRRPVQQTQLPQAAPPTVQIPAREPADWLFLTLAAAAAALGLSLSFLLWFGMGNAALWIFGVPMLFLGVIRSIASVPKTRR